MLEHFAGETRDRRGRGIGDGSNVRTDTLLRGFPGGNEKKGIDGPGGIVRRSVKRRGSSTSCEERRWQPRIQTFERAKRWGGGGRGGRCMSIGGSQDHHVLLGTRRKTRPCRPRKIGSFVGSEWRPQRMLPASVSEHRERRTSETPVGQGVPTQPNASGGDKVQIWMLHARKTVGAWLRYVKA